MISFDDLNNDNSALNLSVVSLYIGKNVHRTHTEILLFAVFSTEYSE